MHAINGYVVPYVMHGVAIATTPGAGEATPEPRHIQSGLPEWIVHVLLTMLKIIIA
jgi:hypothetical protein